MKPFYHNTVFFEATTEELCELREAVDHMRWMYQEFPDHYEHWNKLYNDITQILEQLPF